MNTRVQTINDDTSVEITDAVVQKERHSEKALLRRKAYFEEMIAKGQAGLEKVEGLLNTIDNERQKSGR